MDCKNCKQTPTFIAIDVITSRDYYTDANPDDADEVLVRAFGIDSTKAYVNADSVMLIKPSFFATTDGKGGFEEVRTKALFLYEDEEPILLDPNSKQEDLCKLLKVDKI